MVEHLKRFFTQALQSNLFQDFVFIYGLSILPFTLVGTFLIVLCIYIGQPNPGSFFQSKTEFVNYLYFYF